MPPLCVSYYHMSPDLMGLTAISTITAQLPVRGRRAQTQRSFGRSQVTGGSKQEKVSVETLKHNFWLRFNALTTWQVIYHMFFSIYFLPHPITQWPTNSQLTDVINQSPEEIRCNSIQIPLPLRSY